MPPFVPTWSAIADIAAMSSVCAADECIAAADPEVAVAIAVIATAVAATPAQTRTVGRTWSRCVNRSPCRANHGDRPPADVGWAPPRGRWAQCATRCRRRLPPGVASALRAALSLRVPAATRWRPSDGTGAHTRRESHHHQGFDKAARCAPRRSRSGGKCVDTSQRHTSPSQHQSLSRDDHDVRRVQPVQDVLASRERLSDRIQPLPIKATCARPSRSRPATR